MLHTSSPMTVSDASMLQAHPPVNDSYVDLDPYAIHRTRLAASRRPSKHSIPSQTPGNTVISTILDSFHTLHTNKTPPYDELNATPDPRTRYRHDPVQPQRPFPRTQYGHDGVRGDLHPALRRSSLTLGRAVRQASLPTLTLSPLDTGVPRADDLSSSPFARHKAYSAGSSPAQFRQANSQPFSIKRRPVPVPDSTRNKGFQTNAALYHQRVAQQSDLKLIPPRISSVGQADIRNTITVAHTSRLRRKNSIDFLTRDSLPGTTDTHVAEDGSDDLTVRRIQQLKDQRASRIRFSALLDLPLLPSPKSLSGSLPRSHPHVDQSILPSTPQSTSSIADHQHQSPGCPGDTLTAMPPIAYTEKRDQRRLTSRLSQVLTRPMLQKVRTRSMQFAGTGTLAPSPSLPADKNLDMLDFPESNASLPSRRSRRFSMSRNKTHGTSRPSTPALKDVPLPVNAMSSPGIDIREAWHDEVSERVDAFLSCPRLSQTIKMADTGRVVSFSEVGDANGAAVIVCVGMGLTRYVSAFYDELASSLGLRLITPERPGIGASEAYGEAEPGGPMAWSKDVLAICQHLEITSFSLLGHSAGAIYAMSTAVCFTKSVRGSVQLLAPWIPPSQFSIERGSRSDQSPGELGALPRSQRLLRALPVSVLKAANSNLLGFNTGSMSPPPSRRSEGRYESPSPSRSVRAGSPVAKASSALSRSSADRGRRADSPLSTFRSMADSTSPKALPLQLSATSSPLDGEFTFAAESLSAAQHRADVHDAQYSSLLVERIWELATRNANAAVDLLVCLERVHEVGFSYFDVTQRIVITHGAQDKRVPLENVRWLKSRLNKHHEATANTRGPQPSLTGSQHCELRIVPEQGHGLMASASVMADVLTDIAKEAKRRI